MTKAARLQANVINGVRREQEDGRWYVVAPAVLCRAKVLNDWLVTPEALRTTVGKGGTPENPKNLWEGVPVNIDHPPAELTSMTAIFRWCERHKIGVVRNAELVGTKLVGELWFAADTEDERARAIIESVEAGRLIDVSIGVHTGLYAAEGIEEGEAYSAVAVSMAPFHLAVLPDKRGACSVSQGCGTPRTASAEVHEPEFKGVELTPWVDVDSSLDAYAREAYKALGLGTPPARIEPAELPESAAKWIAAKTLLGDPLATTEAGLLAYPIVNPATGALNKGALFAILGGRALQANIAEPKKAAARRLAMKLLQERFNMPQMIQAETKVCGHRLGKVLASALDIQASSDSERGSLVARIAEAGGLAVDKIEAILKGEGEVVPEKTIDAFALVLGVDRGLLYGAADSDVRAFMRLLDQQEGVNSQPQQPGFFQRLKTRLAGGHNKVPQQNEAKPEIQQFAQANNLSDEERRVLEGLDSSLVSKLLAAKPAESAGNKPAAGAEGVEQKTAASDSGAAVAMTEEQFLAAMPPRFREALQRLDASESAETAQLIGQIKAAGAKAELSDEDLQGLPLATLRKLASAVQPQANYVGANGGAMPYLAPSRGQIKAAESVESPYQVLANLNAFDPNSARKKTPATA